MKQSGKISQPEKLLSISKAAEILSIHPLTLRNWTEQGHLPYYRTPGGHRRFKRQDLMNFLAKMDHRELEPNEDADVDDEALREMIANISQKQVHRALPPMQNVSEDDRLALRNIGRHLLGLIIQYVGEGEHEDVLQQGEDLGRRYGQFARSNGLSYSEIVHVFNFFRDTILEVTFSSTDAQHDATSPNSSLLLRMNHFLNRVLEATVEAAETEASSV